MQLLLDCKRDRIYCSTREGNLLFIDIKEPMPKVVFYLPVALRVLDFKASNAVKSIHHDQDRNMLLLAMKNSDILVV